MTSLRQLSRVALACLTLLVGCAAPGDEENSAQPDVAESEAAIVLAQDIRNNRHPEIARWSLPNGVLCTATMLSPRYFISSAGCISRVPRATGAAAGNILITRLDGSQLPARPVAQAVSLGSTLAPTLQFGASDVAVGQLVTPLTAAQMTGWGPARLSPRLAGDNEPISIMGYGCVARGGQQGLGFKRVATFTFNGLTSVLCGQPDMGAPKFLGAVETPILEIIGIGVAINGAGNDQFVTAVNVKLRVEMIMRVLEGGMDTGMNRVGADIDNLASNSAIECANQCEAHNSCRAWTWSSTQNRCFRKRAAGEMFHDPSVTSGIALPFSLFDRPGGNVLQSAAANFWDVCVQRCAANADCRAYRWLDETNTCVMLRDVPALGLFTSPACVLNPLLCISGVKHDFDPDVLRTQSASAFLPGGEVAATAPACAQACARNFRCVSYNFNPSQPVGPRCALFRTFGTPSTSFGAASGLRSQHGMEFDIDRVGGDLRCDDFLDVRPELCQTDCLETATCVAWTMIPTASGGRCCLKNQVTQGRAAVGLVSGLRGAEFF
jgi:hypothetical protein